MDYRELRHCYLNLFVTAMEENFRYVEGYALPASHNFPMLHAWNLDAEGFVVDRTWDPPGRAYLGVIFPIERIPKGRGGKLYAVIDDWEHGFPVLRKPLASDVSRTFASYASI